MTSYYEHPVKVSIYPVVSDGEPQKLPTVTLDGITLSVAAEPTASGRMKTTDADLYRALAVVCNEAAEQFTSRAIDAEFDLLRERFE